MRLLRFAALSDGLSAGGSKAPATWSQDESGRVSNNPFEPWILAATLALVPVFILENDATGRWHTFAVAANWAIWGLFAVELAFILTVAPRKAAALRAHWLDAAVVTVSVPLFGALLSSMRFIRLARLLRLFRAGVVLGRALKSERVLTSRDSFRFVAIASAFLVVVAGAAQATFDHRDFTSFWNAIWWSVVTVTTVGYGDLYPTSVGGRLIAMALMLVGIGFLSVLTATISSVFVKSDRHEETSDVIDALRRIEAEVAELRAELERRS
ncbi:MAG TPA: potassium channel family protein [Gaiellaceae bacterium]|nr:potassium channel family protein [Gaiellaceae bacterium]